jgi:hypothetical protein
MFTVGTQCMWDVLDPSFLTFSLSLYRHPSERSHLYIFSFYSRFTSYNKHTSIRVPYKPSHSPRSRSSLSHHQVIWFLECLTSSPSVRPYPVCFTVQLQLQLQLLPTQPSVTGSIRDFLLPHHTDTNLYVFGSALTLHKHTVKPNVFKPA